MTFVTACFQALARLREQKPQLHAITNLAAIELTANLCLCVGVQPSVTFHPAQIAGFIARTDALLINMGIWDEQRSVAAPLALKAARERSLAWVLDPVKVDRSAERCAEAHQLMVFRPAVIRANAGEMAALLGGDDLPALARREGCVLAVTGAEDRLSDGRRSISLHNGHGLMDHVTAMGCAGTALVAAMLAVEADALLAAAYALAVLGVAGEMAGESAKGPGSFAVAFLDALYGVSEADISTRLKVEVHG